MKPLFTPEEFEKAKCFETLPCECYSCGNTFYKPKRVISLVKKNHKNNFDNYSNHSLYCSKKCMGIDKITSETVECKHCNKKFTKLQCQIKKTPNHFCSRSCSATYNNTHKIHGIRRSKIEIYLEEQLTSLYPGLHIDYNQKDAINSELDIYIPFLKLAFELNGIFHYEPIYGQDKLEQIQNNDHRKFQACAEKEISLCIIDTSGLKYFKPKSAEKYLNIITELINKVPPPRVELGPIL